MDKKTQKRLALVLIGFMLGVVTMYGYTWWQVYHRFNMVWTCQVFTGQLSIDEAKHCKVFLDSRK